MEKKEENVERDAKKIQEIRAALKKIKLKPQKTKQKKPSKKQLPSLRKQLEPQINFQPSKKPDINYRFDSVRANLYETNYSNNIISKNDAAAQEETYNPVLNKESVDEIIRKTKLNNNYKTDNYINPFLQEKFDVWSLFHKIDIQIKYAIDSYSAPQTLK